MTNATTNSTLQPHVAVEDPYPGTMSILKRQIDLMEAYAEYVDFIPTATHMGWFEIDGTRLHPTLLRDSILEAARSRKSNSAKLFGFLTPEEKRKRIHQIYARKTKEMSALWPLIFATENAYRAALTEHYHTRFGSREWWKRIESAIISNAEKPKIEYINGIKVDKSFSSALVRSISSIMDDTNIYASLKKPENAGRFFYHLTFDQLYLFFAFDWINVSEIFSNKLVHGQPITRAVVLDDLQTVRSVRNEIFHSNPVKKSGKFIASAERLLLNLDICPFRWDQDLKRTRYTRPNFLEKEAGEIPPKPAVKKKKILP